MPTLPWLGVGVLLGILFISFVHGSLEKLRGNSPADVLDKTNQLQQQHAQIGAQTNRIQDLERTEAQLNADLRAERRKVADLEAGDIRAQNQMNELNARLVQLEGAIRNRIEKQETLEREGEEKANKTLGLERRCRALVGELVASRQRIDALESREGELSRQINDLNEALARSRQDAAETEERRRETALTLNALELRERGLSRQINDLGEALARSRQDAAAAETEERGRVTALQLRALELSEREPARPINELNEALARSRQDAAETEERGRETALQLNVSIQKNLNLQREVGELAAREEELNRRINHLWGNGP